jgi:hypothetical protein
MDESELNTPLRPRRRGGEGSSELGRPVLVRVSGGLLIDRPRLIGLIARTERCSSGGRLTGGAKRLAISRNEAEWHFVGPLKTHDRKATIERESKRGAFAATTLAWSYSRSGAL